MTKQSLCETNSTLVIKFTALVLYFTYNTWLIVRFDWGIIYCSINEGLVGSVTVEVGDQWTLSLVLPSRKDWWQQRERFTPNSQGISIQFALKWWRICMQMNDGEGWVDLGGWWRSSWCLALSLKHWKWPFSWGMVPLYTQRDYFTLSPALRGSISPIFHCIRRRIDCRLIPHWRGFGGSIDVYKPVVYACYLLGEWLVHIETSTESFREKNPSKW